MNTDQLEREVLGAARRVRQAHLSALMDLRLDVEDPELSHVREGESGGNSEITMYVRRAGDIVDAIEFQICRKGVPTASVEEFETWLRDTFDDVLRRQRSELGQEE